MAPVIAPAHDDAVVPGDAIADDEFVLDLRVIESVTPLVTMMCDTSDTCGSTCENSACASGSYEPF